MNNMENLIAIIKDGVIENVSVGSDEWAASLSEETVNVTGLEVGINWHYKDGEFTDEEGRTIEERKSYLHLQGERAWRDMELASTDFIVPLVDHPKHSTYMTYRQELRDYPSQPDFPNGTRPVKP
jgi:hypothetical protein